MQYVEARTRSKISCCNRSATQALIHLTAAAECMAKLCSDSVQGRVQILPKVDNVFDSCRVRPPHGQQQGHEVLEGEALVLHVAVLVFHLSLEDEINIVDEADWVHARLFQGPACLHRVE